MGYATEECAAGRVELDRRIAEAARTFYRSAMWWDLYCRGHMPIERWPEYFNLRDIILGHKPWLPLATRGSWRFRLAKLISGF